MPYEQESPLAAALGFASNYYGAQTAAQRQREQDKVAREKEQAAVAYQNALIQAEQQRTKLAGDEFTWKQDRAVKDDARADREMVVREKQQAATQAHQERDDALKAAQQKLVADKDRRTYDLAVRKINMAHQDTMAKIGASVDVAQIHAAATQGAAAIRAAATVQAANIGADAHVQAAGINAASRAQVERHRAGAADRRTQFQESSKNYRQQYGAATSPFPTDQPGRKPLAIPTPPSLRGAKPADPRMPEIVRRYKSAKTPQAKRAILESPTLRAIPGALDYLLSTDDEGDDADY